MKNIAVLMLAHDRFDLMRQTWQANKINAGSYFKLFTLDNGSKDPRVFKWLKKNAYHAERSETNLGIAQGFNRLIKAAYDWGAEYFCFVANDIMEPSKWLADRVYFSERRPGMVSIVPFDGPQPFTQCDVIGQFMITRAVVEKVGYFNTEYGLYGPIDLDYNARVKAAGFSSYYVPGRAVHIDHYTNGAEYGYDKNKLVQEGLQKFAVNAQKYQAGDGVHIPYIIFEQQYFQ